MGLNFNRQIKERFKHTILWFVGTLFLSFSIAFVAFIFERNVNTELDTFNELLWWWILSITGLGYGDNHLLSPEGQILGIIVIFSGLILFAIVVTEVASLIKITFERKDKGIIRITSSGHVVIFGYTSLTAGLVKLLHSYFGSDLKIVLISNDTKFNPFPNEVEFIYANPIDKDTFIEANISEAKASIILANDRFQDPDAYSLVIATGVENINSQAVTIVELMDEDYKEIYKEGKIEAFIRRKELLKDLLTNNKEPALIRILEKETTLEKDNNGNAEEKVGLI